MCFTPQISLTTAIIEFIFAGFILIKFRKSITKKFMPVFLFLLGMYQFTEFMLCTTGNYVLWGKVGFIAYTFLPVVMLHFVIRFTKLKRTFVKKNIIYLYFLPVFYVLIAIFSKGFIESGYCHTIFITVNNILFKQGTVGYLTYLFYYYGYIMFSCILLARKYRKDRNPIRKKLYVFGVVGMLSVTFAAALFIIVLPAYNTMFPSVYCEFALLFAIMALIVSYFDNKHKLS